MSWFMDLRRNGVVHPREVETLKEIDLRKLGLCMFYGWYVGFLILALCICNGFVFPIYISIS
jgi:hypothetical protein